MKPLTVFFQKIVITIKLLEFFVPLFLDNDSLDNLKRVGLGLGNI